MPGATLQVAVACTVLWFDFFAAPEAVSLPGAVRDVQLAACPVWGGDHEVLIRTRLRQVLAAPGGGTTETVLQDWRVVYPETVASGTRARVMVMWPEGVAVPRPAR